jgi:hypothetical protein
MLIQILHGRRNTLAFLSYSEISQGVMTALCIKSNYKKKVFTALYPQNDLKGDKSE